MIDKKSIEDYILSAARVTIPALQQRFSADYRTVYKIVEDLVERGLLRYDRGVEYVTTKSSPAPFAPVFVQPLTPAPPASPERPIGRWKSSNLRKSNEEAVKEMLDGVFGPRSLYDTPAVRNALNPTYDDLFDDDDDEDEDEDEDEDDENEGVGNSDGETFSLEELHSVLSVTFMAEQKTPASLDADGLGVYTCGGQRFLTDVAAAVLSVKELIEIFCRKTGREASVSKIYLSWTVAAFEIGTDAESFDKILSAVKHFAAGAFASSSIDCRKKENLIRLVAPLPKSKRKKLAEDTFEKLFRYPRRQGLYFPVGRTYDGEDFLCDLGRRDLLITGEMCTEASAALHAGLRAMTKKYGPDRLRLFLFSWGHGDFLPYETLPQLGTTRIVTTKEGLFALLSTLKELRLDEEDAIPLCILHGLPPMEDGEKEAFTKLLREIMTEKSPRVRFVLSEDCSSGKDILAEISDLFSARLCFFDEEDSASDLCAEGEMTAFTPAAPLLVGGGDALYRADGTARRLQTVKEEDPRETVRRATVRYPAGDRIEIPEPDGSILRLDPPEKTYLDALTEVVRSDKASISSLQRKLGVGYNYAGKTMDWMEQMGYITAFTGHSFRKVLLSPDMMKYLYGINI